jgi:hypothetical protein
MPKRKSAAVFDEGMESGVKFQPKELELYDAVRHTEYVEVKGKKRAANTIVGFGGARGGTKSHGGRNVTLSACMDPEIAPIRSFIYRRTYEDVNKNHVRKLIEEHPWLQSFYSKNEKAFFLPNGSIIDIIYAENKDDIFRYRGQEWDLGFIEEAGETWPEHIKFLRSCVRTTKKNWVAKLMLSFNPGGRAHKFLKRVFVDRIYEHEEKDYDYKFIQACNWDNAFWVVQELERDGFTIDQYHDWSDKQRMDYAEENSQYWHALLTSNPPHIAYAYIYGKWDLYEGQFFRDFYRDVHVKEFEVDTTWSVIAGLDYGNRTVLELVAKDHTGNIYCFDELVLDDITRDRKARVTVDWLTKRNRQDTLVYGDVTMWSNFAKETGSAETPAWAYHQAGMRYLQPVSKASQDGVGFRVTCNDAISSALYWKKDNEGTFVERPRVFIHPRCKQLISEMTDLQTDPDNMRDFLDGQEDDAYDAFKYAFMRIYSPRKAALPALHVERSIMDATSVYSRKNSGADYSQW